MSTAIVPGSLSAIAQRFGTNIAEAFLGASTIALIDVSGSMNSADSRDGRRRYDVACEELARLQAAQPGKVAVIAFSASSVFCPGGVPIYQGLGTDLTRALEFVKIADGTVRFIVVSDGIPNNPESAIAVARTFVSKIDTIFVGPEDDIDGGRAFLAKLAAASGGRSITADRAMHLAEQAQSLMLAAG